jgi:hypothetical protein
MARLVKKYNNSPELGSVGYSDQGNFKVISGFEEGLCTIQFTDTGYTKTVKKYPLINGSVTDPYFKSKYGEGYLGEGVHRRGSDELAKCGTKFKPSSVYNRWSSMFSRCYNQNDPEYNLYGGMGGSVSEQWKNFQNYADFFEGVSYQNLELDKDILVPGNKVYSQDNCVFVPRYVNALVKLKIVLNGYPAGVYFKKDNSRTKTRENPFAAETHGKHLGSFPTAMDAHRAWQLAKANVIEQTILKYMLEPCYRQDVANAIYLRAEMLRDDHANHRETFSL